MHNLRSGFALFAVLPLWAMELIPGVKNSKWHRDSCAWVGNVLWED